MVTKGLFLAPYPKEFFAPLVVKSKISFFFYHLTWTDCNSLHNTLTDLFRFISTAFPNWSLMERSHQMKIYSIIFLGQSEYMRNTEMLFKVDLVSGTFQEQIVWWSRSNSFDLIPPRAKEDIGMLWWLRPLWECIGNNFIAKIQVPSFPEQHHPQNWHT